MSQNGPADGVAWRPTPSGNHVTWDGETVIKRFGTRLGAYAREGALLERLGALADPLPVPRPLPGRRFGELRYAYLDGVPAGEAIGAGLAPQVLRAMGAFLRRLHAVDPRRFADLLPGAGPVVAHGDFAPSNVLVDGATGALVGVLDWEEARLDGPALDLAWCEAQVLARHPHLRGALRHLYDAYGDAPDRTQRERALARRMEALRGRAGESSGDAAGRRTPETPALLRCAFADGVEAAAFVAALSRFLAGPEGAAYRSGEAGALVWAAAAADSAPQDVYLTEAALRATAARFGTPPVVEAIPFDRVPASCVLLYGAGAVPAWGAAEARPHFT